LNKAKSGRVDLYFIGDSIIRRWGATDYPELLAHWQKCFHGWNAGNFAWGADSTQHMIWRLENGELDGVEPKVIVVLAGTNNIGSSPPDVQRKADELTAGIREIIRICREKAPRATVVVIGITPRNDDPSNPLAAMATIRRTNEQLAKLADGKTVRFLNVNDKLADSQGRLFHGLAPDKLHLSLAGYQVLADGLRPLLAELLGPPNDIDLSPAPTGDPSAAK
jgi:lysophospholipase L1-like esterase